MSLRQNIRNAMIAMTTVEARNFADSFDHNESRGYAEEFLYELEEDFGDCADWV